jgi:hypothetical protein
MHTAHLRSLTVIRVSNRREGKGRTNGTVVYNYFRNLHIALAC